MALATQTDVETDLGRALTEAESLRVDGLLARAEAVVMGYLGCAEDPDPVPAGLASSVAAIVGRALSFSPDGVGVESVAVDDTTVRYSAAISAGGVWLSKMDMLALRRYRCGGGLASVQLVSERYTITP